MEPHRIPKGHLRGFVSPRPGPNMLSTVDVDKQGDEDEAGDMQVIVWRDLFAKRRRELGSQVVEVTGRVFRWDAIAEPSAEKAVKRWQELFGGSFC